MNQFVGEQQQALDKFRKMKEYSIISKMKA